MTLNMFYSFELQMAGVILLSAMTVCGVSLWIKRRKDKKKFEEIMEYDDSQNL